MCGIRYGWNTISAQNNASFYVTPAVSNHNSFLELFRELFIFYFEIDAETRFVNATEKLLPVINIYLDKGKTWKAENMTWDVLVPNKDKKIAISDLPNDLWNEFKPLIEDSGLLPKEVY